MTWLLPTVLGFAAFVALLSAAPWLVARWQRRDERKALELFRLRREVLEARFFELAAASGKPRGLRWKHCEWKSPVYFARDLQTGLITAFSAVEIHFEAIAGGDMEEVAAVGDVREASAVFHYQHGAWGTGGKALFNMPPELAREKLAGQFTPLP